MSNRAIQNHQQEFKSVNDCSSTVEFIQAGLTVGDLNKRTEFLLAALNSEENFFQQALIKEIFESNLFSVFERYLHLILASKDSTRDAALNELIQQLITLDQIPKNAESIIKNLAKGIIDENFNESLTSLNEHSIALLLIFNIAKIRYFTQKSSHLEYKKIPLIIQSVTSRWFDLTDSWIHRTAPIASLESKLRPLIFLLHRENDLKRFMSPVKAAIACGNLEFVEQLHSVTLQVLPWNNLFAPHLTILHTLEGICKSTITVKKDSPIFTDEPRKTYINFEYAIQQEDKDSLTQKIKTFLTDHFGVTGEAESTNLTNRIIHLHSSKRSLALYMIAELAHAKDEAAITQLTSKNNPKLEIISRQRHRIYDFFRTTFGCFFSPRPSPPLLQSRDEKFTGSTTRQLFLKLATLRKSHLLPLSEESHSHPSP